MKFGDVEIIETGKQRDPHPGGNFVARLADMFLEPEQNGNYGLWQPARTIWITGKKDEEGGDIWLFQKIGTNSKMTKKGTKPPMRLLKEALIGHPLGEEESQEIDSDVLIGRYAMVNVGIKAKGGKVFAQIETVTPVPEGMTVKDISLAEYIRPKKIGPFCPDAWNCPPKWLGEAQS